MNIERPIILLFTGFYLPGYKAGGILRTIANTVDNLKDDFEFKIVTSDRDLGDSAAYPSIAVNEWNKVGNAQVYYLNTDKGVSSKIKELIKATKYDILHLNSFFDPVFTIKLMLLNRQHLLLDKPIIISPRGEFNPTQIRFKSWKKKAFIKIARLFKLYHNVTWHASDVQEAKDIARNWGIEEKCIVKAQDLPNPVLVPVTDYEPEEGVLKIIYLSRISKEKNLKYAVEIISRVKVKVVFDIYGPIEDKSYWADCERLIKGLNGSVKVRYCGSVKPANVHDVMYDYDLFFLPTFAENYGHAIVEALLTGLPVLISDGTPWRNLSELHLGWDIDLDNKAAFIEAIEQFSKVRVQQKRADRTERSATFQKRLSAKNIKKDNYDLFHNVLQLNKDKPTLMR